MGWFLYITAAGDKARVAKGRTVIINTIFGIIVIFMAWTAVNFVINKMAGTSKVMTFTDQEEDRVEWYNLCKGDGTFEDCTGKGDGYPCGNDMNRYCLNSVCQPGQEQGNSEDGWSRSCDWLREQAKMGGKGPYSGYECREVGPNNECGVRTVAECDVASNCIKNLCGLDTYNINRVCCTPK